MNSKRGRVEPVFGWLRDQGGPTWPAELLALCDGLQLPMLFPVEANGEGHGRGRKKKAVPPVFQPGPLLTINLEDVRKVKASPTRLAWMIRNVQRLAPRDAKRWRDEEKRVLEHPGRDKALALLDGGERKGVPKKLILEGPTHADCLIECDRLLLWIDGQRHDWLAPSTKRDLGRDQLARNLEAARQLACEADKDFCWILCHEHELKNHEIALIEGYRQGTWRAGLPHLDAKVRGEMAKRIGTVTWSRLLAHWPEMSELPELENLEVAFG